MIFYVLIYIYIYLPGDPNMYYLRTRPSMCQARVSKPESKYRDSNSEAVYLRCAPSRGLQIGDFKAEGIFVWLKPWACLD